MRVTPLVLVAPAVAFVLVARADSPYEPIGSEAKAIFAHFDHRVHTHVFARQGIGCTACHEVGGAGDPRTSAQRLDEVFLEPPGRACHYCHNPPGDEAEIGPGQCRLCHEHPEPPEGHGAGWIDRHGSEARLGVLTCDDCHRDSFCVDCHQRRDRIDYRGHDRTWIAVHGIAAMTDPSECGTCHLQHDCESCHTGQGRLP